MNVQMKKIMEDYLNDMQNITPDHPEYVERNRIALEYAKLLNEEETKSFSNEMYEVQRSRELEEWKRDMCQRTSNYRPPEPKGPSIGSIALGVGGAILGILGVCAYAKSSSEGSSYTCIEDNTYDYNDFSSYSAYNDYSSDYSADYSSDYYGSDYY